MANNHITDLVSTVTLSKSEYEDLVRESNTLRIIENVLVSTGKSYIDTKLLKDILGMFEDELEDIDATTD